ncbi:MAG: CotH kinase family protein [Lachnospiraceae bacterium]|nr:CotH kinase family protein [Lachnospiraceae bacterium]
MLRNFGTQDGELYKPDSMEMGGGKSSSGSSGSSEGGFPGNMPSGDIPSGGDGSFPSGGFPGGSGDGTFPSGGFPGGDGEGGFNFNFDPDQIPEGGFPGNMPSGDIPSGGDGTFPSGGFPGGSGDGSFPGGSKTRPGSGNSNGGNSTESNTSSDSITLSDAGFFGGNFSFPGGGDSGNAGFGGFTRGGGANLNYSDDDLDSYSTIWDGSITNTGTADHRRVVTALKNISEGTELETYLDVDNVLKYMAVHAFAVNMDSLSGSMAHNYYLYEYDGQLNIFPWDYNLSFGGMSMGSSGSATDMVNDAIDTPFAATNFFDALLENEEYLAKYHEYLQQLVDEYINGGRFDEVYQRIRSQIDELVATDPTAFYTQEEYLTAVELLHETVLLRAESIQGQLDGTIPSTDEGQKKDSSTLVDASHINVKDMGTFNMGGNNFEGEFKKSKKSGPNANRWGNRSQQSQDSSSGSTQSGTDGNTQGSGGSTQGSSDNTQRDSSRKPQSGFNGDSTQGGSSSGSTQSGDGTNPWSGGGFSFDNMPDMSSFAGQGFLQGGFSAQGTASGLSTSVKSLLTYGGCLALMLVALLFAKLYKRRK